MKRVRASGRHVLVDDPKAREAMRLVVRLRHGGASWSTIVCAVEHHFARVENRRPNPDNPEWKRTTCQRAFTRELEAQRLEELPFVTLG